MSARNIFIFFPLGLLLCACPQRAKPPGDVAASSAIDVCSLLSASEVEAAMDAAPREMRPLAKPAGRFVGSECFVALPEARDSIRIEVIQPGPANHLQTARAVWEETFREGKKADDDEREEKGDGEAKQFEPVPGLGDEAYWTGYKAAGTLHILQGERIIRLNVGGPNDPAVMTEKLRKLAGPLLRALKERAP